MHNPPLSPKLRVLLSTLMILAGLAVGAWAIANSPIGQQVLSSPTDAAAKTAAEKTGAVTTSAVTTSALQPVAALGNNAQAMNTGGAAGSAVMAAPGQAAPGQALATPPPALMLGVDLGDAPHGLLHAFTRAAAPISNTVALTDAALSAAFSAASPSPALTAGLQPGPASTVYTVTFAAATRFDTVDPAISMTDLRAAWSRDSVTGTITGSLTGTVTYTQIAVLTDTLPALRQVLGQEGPAVKGFAEPADVVNAAWQGHTTLALVPFDVLEPRLVVLAVDGQNPVENANHFNPAKYPLTVPVYVRVTATDPAQSAPAQKIVAALPAGNRVADHLTVVAMTGVTAMCRQTAAQMDRLGPGWPAEVVGPELASADITAISNEVPFVPDCKTNINPDNLNFCSKPAYMATLRASGADIIGLTGNHVNDYGIDDAMKSLAIYEQAKLPVYGGGPDKKTALQPLMIEHNGNRLAFLGANSFGPKFALATDTQPGSAPFDLNIMSAMIRELKQSNSADVVLAELQYQESYDTQPLIDQRKDFNALVKAGADIVTGVQSHVPQAMEFTDDKLILYGLGNLYFDQMFSQATREGMIVKHTIYEGRHISTQVLTTLIYDFGQPRWTTPAERANLLDRVFAVSYW